MNPGIDRKPDAEAGEGKDPEMPPLEPALERAVKEHLQAQYTGVFPPSQLPRHFEEYVGLKAASELFGYMRDCARPRPGARLLDVGCGFGSFVLLARNRGLDALGIDVADFDLGFARARLRAARPGEDAEAVYRKMDAARMDFPDGTFDIVTLWNVLEHVPDAARLIAETARVLKPGGICLMLAPNYLAFRQEAHYLVPWLPLFPKRLAAVYLRMLGRDPAFLEQGIFYVTNTGIRQFLRKTGFRIDPNGTFELQKLERIEALRPGFKKNLLRLAEKMNLLRGVRLLLLAQSRNPFRGSIQIFASKPHGAPP